MEVRPPVPKPRTKHFRSPTQFNQPVAAQRNKLSLNDDRTFPRNSPQKSSSSTRKLDERRKDELDLDLELEIDLDDKKQKNSLITTTRNVTSKLVRRSFGRRGKSVDETDVSNNLINDRSKVQNSGVFSTDEFFNSISFHSPLAPDSNSDEDLNKNRTISPPPPTFPPPELPSNSAEIYDGVQFHSLDRKYRVLSSDKLGPKLTKKLSKDVGDNSRNNSDQSLSSTSDKSIGFHKELSCEDDEEKKCLLDNEEIYLNPFDIFKNNNKAEVNDMQSIDKFLLEEFDPLKDDSNPDIYENNDAMFLERLLASNSENNINFINETNDLDDNISYQVSSTPPKPPRRFDSLPKHEYDEVELVEQRESTTNPTKFRLTPSVIDSLRTKLSIDESLDKISEFSARRSVMDKLKHLKKDSVAVARPSVIDLMKNTLKNRHSHLKKSKRVNELCVKWERPPSCDQVLPVFHRGIIFRTKDLVKRFACLKQQKILFYVNEEMTVSKDAPIDLMTIQSVHLLQDVKVVNDEPVHCIAVACDKTINVFYIKGITERRIWAQKIIESMTSVFPTKYIAELTRAGWAYLKEGVTGSWFPAWIVLQHRTLIYTKSSDPSEFEELDLRKARCILLRDQEDTISNGEKISAVVINIEGGNYGAVHLTAPGLCEVPAWRHALYQAATCCGPSLNEQQLTHDNVPVIFDKCINFIYTHGILSDGIYRKGGSSSAVIRLMEDFRKDAWAVQLTRSNYSEHDVATVLRRFVRNIPESLIPYDLHEDLFKVLEICDDEKRIETYKKILSKLETVSSNSLKRILAHLYCLSQQSSKNLMTIENISAIWGPTLMHSGIKKSPKVWNGSESKVVDDLITLYPQLYDLSATELDKEAKILEVLQKHHGLNTVPRSAPSGDLKIWIYLFSRDKESVNVTIGPQKTAGNVCEELAERVKIPAHRLCLHESTLGGALWRPLHFSEYVLETISRWGYWDSSDRKDNVLILQPDTLFRNIIPNIKPPMTISGELKYADNKSKNMKVHFFEFSQAKLSCYKDKAYSVKLYEWKIEDIIWYLGHEPKRNLNANWSITFILKKEHPTRSKHGAPYFGNILAGSLDKDLYNWMAAFLLGEYQLNILPKDVDSNNF